MNLLGFFLKPDRFLYVELTKIYGIGFSSSVLICKKMNILAKKVQELSIDEVNNLSVLLGNMLLGVELKRTILLNVKRLVSIRCYRGLRHKNKLPVQGQRTRSNSRTARRVSIL